MIKPLTIGEIVNSLGGQLVGDPHLVVSCVSSLRSATSGSISFFVDKRHIAALRATAASVIITSPEFSELTESVKIITENPYLYFVKVINLLNAAPNEAFQGISDKAHLGSGVEIGERVVIMPNAIICDNVFLGDDVVIGAGCYLGSGVSIGNFSKLYPNVTVYDDVRVGKNVIVHSGAVLGSDGFGFVNECGRWYKVPQIGGLVVGNDVEVGSNTTIDRGALDDTLIGDGVKIDNQVQVGHNCSIGDDTVIAGCVGIAGSVKIGKRCKIGGAAMITGHLDITDDVTISAGSLVAKTIKLSGRYTGVYPLSEHGEWLIGAVELRKMARTKGRVS
jgi:UDP-3-O-[3-hydroxymyristoyl] glucosamine N-acyltransferase